MQALNHYDETSASFSSTEMKIKYHKKKTNVPRLTKGWGKGEAMCWVSVTGVA
jgi:hypothetical protein